MYEVGTIIDCNRYLRIKVNKKNDITIQKSRFLHEKRTNLNFHVF